MTAARRIARNVQRAMNKLHEQVSILISCILIRPNFFVGFALEILFVNMMLNLCFRI